MTPDDASVVYKIENDSFFEPWSKKQLIKELEHNSFLKHFVYEKDGEVVGFYIVSHVADLGEIFTIAVDLDHRGEGIGEKLLNHLIEKCYEANLSEIWLEASTKNIPAVNLYKKFGFKIQKVRKNYYQKTGEDAYNMIRIL